MSQVQQVSNSTETISVPRNLDTFTKCHLPKYSGECGATSLLKWFEGVEQVFTTVRCPAHLSVKYAVSVFTKHALTWWKHEELILGKDLAYAMTWNDLKTSMLMEFAARNEIRTLEKDFWELKQIEGDNAEYTSRFRKLSVLFPHMVTPLSIAIERYVNGLPSIVRSKVLGCKSASLGETMRIAALVTERLVENNEWGYKEKDHNKSVEGESSEFKEPLNKKRKAKYVVNSSSSSTTPPQPQPHHQPSIAQQEPPKKNYTGTYPLCVTCGYHHTVGFACRWCTNCNRYGHWAATCRKGVVAPISVNVQAQGPKTPQCFGCGEMDHVVKKCPNNQLALAPKLQPQLLSLAHDQAYVLGANRAQENNVEANGP